MPTKPSTIPRLGVTTGGTLTATAATPGAGLQDSGFDVGDTLPAQIFDWFTGWAGKWFQWLDSLETQALTWTAVQTFSARAVFNDGGLVNAPTTANRSGWQSTANGTGAGMEGIASATAGSKGVWGQAGNGNYAVVGGNSGSGSGGGFSSVSGYGAECAGNATRAPLRLFPLASPPSTAQEGDFYPNSVDHKVYYYNGTSWVVLGSQS